MSAPFEQIDKKNRAVVNTVTTVTGATTMWLSYVGAAAGADPAGGLWSAISPAVYAIGTGSLVYGHYKLGADIMPKCKTVKGRLLSGTVMAAGLAGMIALSSPLNLSAMAGSEALNQHMRDALATYERTVEQSYQRGLRLESLVPVITLNADRLERNAQEEARFGRVSNVAGNGAVSRTLADGGAQVRGLLTPVRETLARVKDRGKSARATLEKARQVIASEGDVSRRMRAFAREADSLRSTLAEMDVSAVAASIEQVGLNLPESIVGRTRSDDRRIAAAQAKSMAFILKNLKSTGSNIAASAAQIANLPRIEVPEFERISRIRASLRYAGSFLPLAIGSVMLDCAPVLVCLWLMLASAEGTRSSEIRMRAGQMTLDEMLDAQDAMSLLNERQRRHAFIGDLLGDDPDSAPASGKTGPRKK